jgi:ribosomal protein S27E
MVTRSQGDPPVPLRLAVLDLLTEFDDIPLSWARAHAEEHDLTPPRNGPEYLQRHLASVESSEWILPAWEEITGLVYRAHVLVPWRPQVTRLGAPCPECHCQALVLVGGDDWVTCRECGATIPEDRYGLWSKVILHEREREAA